MLDFTQRSTISHLESHATPEISTDTSFSADPRHVSIAIEILRDVMQFRRVHGPQATCASSPCQKCVSPHLAKIISAVALGQPVTFVLPAFPGKSPNLAKVLGTLPDMAEWRALEFLDGLCDRIQQYYHPGARVILCSDGRVFSDVVGMRDVDVTAYQEELSKMISESGFTSISTFDLDDLYRGLNFDQMRDQLMAEHGEPLDRLRAAVTRGGKKHDFSVDDQEANRLYCGITKFLVEDAMFPGQTKSRSAIQKECRARAYAVIQRSQAWSEWVEARFPDAVRLSIHPQACGSKKIGIRLFKADHWLTPWHGVAVEVNGQFMLLKRSQAEALGATLIHLEGRPSHFVLAGGKDLAQARGVKNGA